MKVSEKMNNPTSTAPNIFDYATGELSQDAFLAWLAMWADEKYKGIDLDLNTVARNFLVSLCENKISNSDIDTVSVKLQYKKTDVLIDITSNTPAVRPQLIVIEDKTGSGTHSQQLERYKEAISEQLEPGGDFENYEVHYIYFKTEDHITHEADLHGFNDFSRQKALSILASPTGLSVKNQIFIDYITRLKRIEKESQDYIGLPHENWRYPQWSGFMMALCKELGGDANFGYVPNASGGFIGAWFGWTTIEGMTDNDELYLQMGWAPGSVFDLKLRVGSPDRESTERLKQLVLPILRTKFDNSQTDYSSKNIRKGRSVALISFEGLNISEENNKVAVFASKVREILSAIKDS